MPKVSDSSSYPAITGSQLANNDRFYVVDVGSPNVGKGIVVDELAQAPQFSSRYSRLNSRVTFSNANASITATVNTYLAQVGTLTASRTVTLPAANSVAAGTEMIVADESGTVTSTNTIVIARAGSDTINGATSDTIAVPYGWRRFVSDGTSKWTFDGGVIRSNLLTTDGDLLTRASGSPTRVTRDSLAQDVEFSSRYAPLAVGERITLGAGSLGPSGGSPTLGNPNGSGALHAAWLLDSSVDESVSGCTYLPSSWTTFHVDLLWCNAGTGTGNVTFYIDYTFAGDGDATNGGGSPYSATVAAPSTRGQLKVSRVFTGVTNQSSKLFLLRSDRGGSFGLDTLPNDIGIFGYLLTRAS